MALTVFFVHPKTTETAAFGYLFEVVQEGELARMPDDGTGTEILNLGQDFPPVAAHDVGSGDSERPEGR